MNYDDPTELDTYPLAEEATSHDSADFYGADAGDLAIFLHERRDLWEKAGECHPWTIRNGFDDELRRFTEFDSKIKKIIELSVDPDNEIVFDDFLDDVEQLVSDQGWTYINYECDSEPDWKIAIFVSEVRGDFEFKIEFVDEMEDVPIEEHKITVTSGVVSWGLK